MSPRARVFCGSCSWPRAILAVLMLLVPVSTAGSSSADEEVIDLLDRGGILRGGIGPLHLGTLDNGVRYVWATNVDTTGSIAVALRVDVGFAHETPDTTAFAHLLEHVAFRTVTCPDGGPLMDWGTPHTDPQGAKAAAYTSPLCTVFGMNLQGEHKPQWLDALCTLAEIGGGMTLQQQDIDAELAITKAERMYWNAPEHAKQQQPLNDDFSGTALGNRDRSISPDRPVSAAELQAFYDAQYRPERMTVFVVGDIDPATIRGHMSRLFGSLARRGHEAATASMGALDRSRPVSIRTDSEQPFVTMTVSLVNAVESPALADAALERNHHLDLAASCLYDALEKVGKQNSFTAGVKRLTRDLDGNGIHGYEYVQVRVTARPHLWRDTLRTVLDVVHHAGAAITEEEVSRLSTTWLATWSPKAKDDVTVPSGSWVQTLSMVEPDMYRRMGTLRYCDLMLQCLAGVHVDEIAADVRTCWAPAYRTVRASGPLEDTNENLSTLREILDAAPSAEPTNLPTVASRPFTYASDLVRRSDVKSQTEVPGLQCRRIALENGIEAWIRPMSGVDDRVTICVRVDCLEGTADDDKTRALKCALPYVIRSGGVEGYSNSDLWKHFDPSQYSLSSVVFERALILNLRVRRENLGSGLDLLSAYLRAPGWRAAGFGDAREAVAKRRTPDKVPIRDEFFPHLFAGLVPLRLASPNGLERYSIDDVANEFNARWKSAPVRIVIAGDVNADETVELCTRSFAAPEIRNAIPPERPPPEPFVPAEAIRKTYEVQGMGQDAQVYLALPYSTRPGADDFVALNYVLSRVREEVLEGVRMVMNATYTVSLSGLERDASSTSGVALLSFRIDKSRVADAVAQCEKRLGNLRTTAVSDAGMKDVHKIKQSIVKSTAESTDYWANVLAFAVETDAGPWGVGTQSDGVKPDIVNAMALELLDPARLSIAIVQSAGAPAAAGNGK